MKALNQIKTAFTIYFEHLRHGHDNKSFLNFQQLESIETHQDILYAIFAAVVTTCISMSVCLLIVLRTIIIWRLTKYTKENVLRYSPKNSLKK